MSLAIFCCRTTRFAWDLVGNPEDRFSHNEAHIVLQKKLPKQMHLQEKRKYLLEKRMYIKGKRSAIAVIVTRPSEMPLM